MIVSRKLLAAAISGMAVTFLAACGALKTNETPSETEFQGDCVEIKEQEEQETPQEPEEPEEPEEDVVEDVEIVEETEPEPEILRFVDVFGEPYETEINPNVSSNEYDNGSFTRDGQILSYEDDDYTSRFGVDVSRHQGAIDWKKAREAGVTFAFIRIGYRGYGTEGSLNLDQRFEENIVNAQKEGIDVGVYFFSQAINEDEAKEEAEFVLNALEGYKLQLPVVYDPESILDDKARTDNVSGRQFTENTILFCNMILEAGYSPMIYSNMLWEAFEFDLEELSDYPIWYADYEPFPQTPYNFEFWQYTNEGSIPGIGAGVDLDIQLIKKE